MVPKFSKPIVLDYRAQNVIPNILFRLLYKNFKELNILDVRGEPWTLVSNFAFSLSKLKDSGFRNFKDSKGNILVNFALETSISKYTRFPIIQFSESIDYPLLPSRICLSKEELSIVSRHFCSSIHTRIDYIDPKCNLLGLKGLHLVHNKLTKKDYKLFMETLLEILFLSVYMYENY